MRYSTLMLTIAFFTIQLISLAIMLIFIHEYKRITYKHHDILLSIDSKKRPKSIIHSTIIIWIYAGVTFAILIGTTAFFYSIIAQL